MVTDDLEEDFGEGDRELASESCVGSGVALGS